MVANAEYRRTGDGGGWPTTFTDVAAAVDALPAVIDRAWPDLIDESRLAYLGHSAGGHLALWAALRDQLPAGTPGWTQAAPRVTGVVALAPVSDLAEAYRQGEGRRAVAEFLGGGPEDVPDRYAASNPMQLGAPRAPVVLIHGDHDQAVPVGMSRCYQLASGAQLLELPSADHFDLIDHRSAAWASVVGVLRRLLE